MGNQLRDRYMTIRHTKGEKEAIMKAYKNQNNITLSEYIREKIQANEKKISIFERREERLKKEVVTEKDEKIRELHKIGTNINQIAKTLNTINKNNQEIANNSPFYKEIFLAISEAKTIIYNFLNPSKKLKRITITQISKKTKPLKK